MKRNNKKELERRSLGRRGFLQGASIAGASLAIPGALAARGSGPLSPQKDAGPGTLAGRDTFIFVFMRGGPDGLAFLAPADDPDYKLLRLTGAQGTRIDDDPVTGFFNTQITTGTPGRQWWLPHALSPLVPILSDLALIPAVGLKDNINKSHFVAMDRMEFGTPPPMQGYNSPITDGFMARMLKTNTFGTSPILRGWVASKLNVTSFLEAPTSLPIPNPENFKFPNSGTADQQLQDAVKDLHNEPGVAGVLADASGTAFGSIDYLDDVFVQNPPAGLSGLGNGAGQYPNHPVGRKFRQAAAMILHGNPPEAIEIDIGGWDHHKDEMPNPVLNGMGVPTPGGVMWGLMDLLARSLAALHGDLSAASYPFGAGTMMDHTMVMGCGEFGRRVEENASKGTDHGQGGVMWALGGAQVIGGVYDSHWTGVGTPTSGQMTEPSGDIIAAIDYRDVIAEAFVKRMEVPTETDIWFNGFSPTALGFVV